MFGDLRSNLRAILRYSPLIVSSSFLQNLQMTFNPPRTIKNTRLQSQNKLGKTSWVPHQTPCLHASPVRVTGGPPVGAPSTRLEPASAARCWRPQQEWVWRPQRNRGQRSHGLHMGFTWVSHGFLVCQWLNQMMFSLFTKQKISKEQLLPENYRANTPGLILLAASSSNRCKNLPLSLETEPISRALPQVTRPQSLKSPLWASELDAVLALALAPLTALRAPGHR